MWWWRSGDLSSPAENTGEKCRKKNHDCSYQIWYYITPHYGRSLSPEAGEASVISTIWSDHFLSVSALGKTEIYEIISRFIQICFYINPSYLCMERIQLTLEPPGYIFFEQLRKILLIFRNLTYFASIGNIHVFWINHQWWTEIYRERK